MKLLTTCAEARAAVAEVRAAGKTLGLVPTMGALHAGHISLVEAARRECDVVAATIFVNPTQFGPSEDFTRYPRDLEADLEQLRAAGADLVFAPHDAREIYPPEFATFVVPEGPALPLEGSLRPGHFRGVATVVLKLLNLFPADAAYFGQKDYQQSLVVRRMVEDLNLPIRIRVCPIVRDADGLALSSRNVYLSADDRRRALVLSRSLRLVQDLVNTGQRTATAILARMRSEFAAAGVTQIDYIALADPDTLAMVETIDRPVMALIAARVGQTRLIDNARIEVGPAVPA